MNVEQRMSIGPQRTNGCTKAQFITFAFPEAYLNAHESWMCSG